MVLQQRFLSTWTFSIKLPTKTFLLFSISVYHVFIGIFFKCCQDADSYIHSQSKRVFYEIYFLPEISTGDGAAILKQGITSTFVSVALILMAVWNFFLLCKVTIKMTTFHLIDIFAALRVLSIHFTGKLSSFLYYDKPCRFNLNKRDCLSPQASWFKGILSTFWEVHKSL